MTPEHEIMETFFEAALKLEPGQRSAFLNAACDGKPELKTAVEALLIAHESHSGFMGGPAPSTHPLPSDGEKPGDIVGNYQLAEIIGEGGCGVVFAAEQQRPLRRRVALKLVRPGMGTREVLARFAAEQQALARLDHPYIAKVFDAGTTASGRPFFVMEWVSGIHLTEFCRRHRLPTRDRLELFLRICRAVEHAHRSGIVHRDLKPSNILVARIDDTPTPRIIDFGIAKAMDWNSQESRLRTHANQFLGTPDYASPEQLGDSTAGIDHRTDIYSLGILLFELLTGERRTKTVASRNGNGQESPSDRLRRMPSPGITAIASEQCVAPDELVSRIRGTLDQIVLKAIATLPSERYATAGDLATDLAGHLKTLTPLEPPPGPRSKPWQATGPFVGFMAALALLIGWVAVNQTTSQPQRATPRIAEILHWDRFHHSAAWTGGQVLVWGGASQGQFLNDGWVYDIASGESRQMPMEGAPSPRANAAACWTGNQFLVWGGDLGGQLAVGGACYESSRNIWTPIPTSGEPEARTMCNDVWTGSAWFVWGGQDPTKSPPRFFGDGALFSPASQTWSPISRQGAPSERTSSITVWTGKEVLVWGGRNHFELGDGGAFDPIANSWRPISNNGSPGPRHYHSGVWTGHELIVWGGREPRESTGRMPGTGGRYDPVTDRWRPMSLEMAPRFRWVHSAVWTGTEMIVWGGAGADSNTQGDGAAYNPATDRWRRISTVGAPSPRCHHKALWTSAGMVIWGGASVANSWTAQLGDGAIYDPAKDRWTPFPPPRP